MMERIINRGTPSAITASGGVLVLGLTCTLWYFESVAPNVALVLLIAIALLLVLFCACYQHRLDATRLRLLEGKHHRLECTHRHLQHLFRQQADQFSASCRNYQELVESANSIIIRWNAQGTIVYANTFALNFFGYQKETFIGQGVLDTIVPPMESTGRDLALMIEDISRNPERYISNENENICKDHRRVWVNWTNKAVRDNQGNTIEVLSVGNDITEKKQYERNIYRLAHYDQLTRLPNRNHMIQSLSEDIATAQQSGRHFSVLYIGLDRFKSINDSLGHDQGDLLLQTLSRRLQACLHPSATVARTGGDEFCIALLSHTDQQHALRNAHAVATDLLSQIRQVFTLGNDNVYLTGSIGISAFPQHATCPGELINHAETAMLRAKARSGNGIQLFESAMGTHALRRLTLENALRIALDDDSLALHYQPALNLRGDNIDYLEALLRWEHPELGVINPGEFVDVAEKSGLMPKLSRWVLQTATRQAASWRAHGYPPVLLAINLSPSQFESDSLLRDIEEALTASGLPTSSLGLEITENAIMRDIEYGQQLLQRISDMGITLLIDDFGTGHSSLARLRNLPVHQVKIDQSFVRDIGRKGATNQSNMLDAIIDMAHGLGLQVIAEGVETEQQRRYLAASGCDRIQGFLLAQAQPAKSLEHGLLCRTNCHPEVPGRRSAARHPGA